MIRLRFILLLWIFRLCSVWAADDWPQFRGPNGDGHADATGLPATWSETENVRWKTLIPGEGWSSPVILGPQVWMTTALENGKSLRAVCVDKESGKILRNVELFHPADPGPKNPLNSFASPTPVIEPGRVYVSFGHNGNACLATQTGAVLWRHQLLKLNHAVGAGSSPMLYRNLFILNCDGMDVRYVAALDKQTGRLVWKTNRSKVITQPSEHNKAYSIPMVLNSGGQDQLVSVGAHRVSAYEPMTGRELWWCDLPGFSNTPRPIYGHGLVYVGTGFDDPELWALRPGGTGDVTSTHVAWTHKANAALKPSLLLVDDELYMVSDSGTVSCLDGRTGAELWRERIGGQYSASPVYADGRIYCFSQDGKTTVFKPGRAYQAVATNQLDAGFMASPAIAGHALYLRTKTHLYRIEKP